MQFTKYSHISPQEGFLDIVTNYKIIPSIWEYGIFPDIDETNYHVVINTIYHRHLNIQQL